jgi:hypothetical protein
LQLKTFTGVYEFLICRVSQSLLPGLGDTRSVSILFFVKASLRSIFSAEKPHAGNFLFVPKKACSGPCRRSNLLGNKERARGRGDLSITMTTSAQAVGFPPFRLKGEK